jgi:hypothetical protein|tara:strand:+ start:445 stop:636 length:192 start_codon:yes stop_codon:yes gene_type:complete
VRKKDERKAIRIKNEIIRREVVRKEEEARLADLPPPPIMANRLEIRFKDPKGGSGAEANKRGT